MRIDFDNVQKTYSTRYAYDATIIFHFGEARIKQNTSSPK